MSTVTRLRALVADVVAARDSTTCVEGYTKEPRDGPFYTALNKLLSEVNSLPETDRSKTITQCKELFNGREGEDSKIAKERLSDPAYIESLEPQVQGVAAMRTLLAVHKVHFDPTGLSAWDEFSRTYDYLIRGA